MSDEDLAQWDGRMCKAGAYGLKARVLLFVASPLFNSDQPYAQGEAAEKKMVWFGNYDKNRWKLAIDACQAFFNALSQNGYYHMVQKEDVSEGDYRHAFRSAYFDRGTTETLISTHRNIYQANTKADNLLLWNSLRWGGYCPTKEYFDMFPMANGEDFDWNNPEHAKIHSSTVILVCVRHSSLTVMNIKEEKSMFTKLYQATLPIILKAQTLE